MRLKRRNPIGSTAGLWRIQDCFDGEIILVHGQPFAMTQDEVCISQGWCWVVATENNQGEAWEWLCSSGLQKQRFATRREALQAVAVQMAISS